MLIRTLLILSFASLNLYLTAEHTNNNQIKNIQKILVKQIPLADKGIPLYYWDCRDAFDFTNFGDGLSEKIIERIVGHRILTTFNHSLYYYHKKNKLLSVGSILHMAENGDVIWGSGVNGKHLDKTDKSIYRFTKLDVRAVRGPLTRKFLLEMGIRCPAVYGDPALLLPKLFPEFKKAQHPSLEYVIIPHPFDEHLFVNHPHFFSNREDWDLVIKKILDSKLVISTSLHGLIVAEAFGIPARYLRVSEGEPLFKYEDYYLGTGRRSFSYATTIEEALAMGGELSPQYNLDQLLKAFPFEFFPKSTNRWIDP